MTRIQLREFHTPERLAEIYAQPYDHTKWQEHQLRVAWTIAIGAEYAREYRVDSILDPACGDGAIALGIAREAGVDTVALSDFNSRHSKRSITVEDTLAEYARLGQKTFDLVILTEILEHVQDPDIVLRDARLVGRHLLLSTPLNETHAHGNEEHYWAWSAEDIRDMLHATSWREPTFVYHELSCPFYTYQLWTVS